MGMGSLLPVFSSTAGTESNFRRLAALTSACPTELGGGGLGFTGAPPWRLNDHFSLAHPSVKLPFSALIAEAKASKATQRQVASGP